METKEKIMLVTRHGKAGIEDDSISQVSARTMYDKAGQELFEWLKAKHGPYTHKGGSLQASNKRRTFCTGIAILSRAFGLHLPSDDNYAHTKNELESLDISFGRDDNLDYDNLQFDKLKMQELGGLPQYIGLWIQQPSSDQIGGGKITPFNNMVNTRGQYLAGRLTNLIAPTNKGGLEVLATHSAVIEALAISALNPGTQTPAEIIDEIGQFDREQYFTLRFQIAPKSGMVTEAKFQRGNNKPISISLQRIMQAYHPN